MNYLNKVEDLWTAIENGKIYRSNYNLDEIYRILIQSNTGFQIQNITYQSRDDVQ